MNQDYDEDTWWKVTILSDDGDFILAEKEDGEIISIPKTGLNSCECGLPHSWEEDEEDE
jgi:hypothetical protein